MMTMEINLQISKKIFSPHFYPFLNDYSHRWEVYMGSAGSGKSHFVIQKLVVKACRSKRKICMCRRYGSTIANSIWDLTRQILRQFKLLDKCSVNKSERTITLPNGSMIIMLGLDDEQKLLSINGITDFFIEEIFECDNNIIDQIDLRLRAKAPNLQIYGAFNPISPHHWLFEFCEGDKRPNSFFYDRSTYKNNPFLPDEYIKSLESLYVRNPNKARIFCDGNWGVDVEGLVFGKNTEFIEGLDVNELLKNPNLEVRIGSDAGVVDPSTIAVTLYDKDNQTIYLIDEWYLRGATLDDHYQAILDLGIHKQKIYVDSADARLVSYLKSKGINVKGAIKGKGSVEARISFLLNHKIIVLKDRCPNATVEFENFSWVKDKQTGKFSEKTTHEWSHLCCDALGYAYCDIYTSKAKVYSGYGLGI
ncbi:PBSX family phage terminase large subunit [Turicibacter sanguinis]|nr:PBSX family phage terminase large subunit [Turicibacter sanguinis]MTN52040.1 PBSX family phage terminase large subunit [Turicibacter sanguinis]MTN55098.1 PBSX family phage terminase large subunit [Turicibacter sanguinis]MTN58305.1 PBSX family phage terminase large subunit [Turicibacter sanguinis]MTN61395.1 PBSX family phage terminase large subunit [Turicibacter sanguinis]